MTNVLSAVALRSLKSVPREVALDAIIADVRFADRIFQERLE